MMKRKHLHLGLALAVATPNFAFAPAAMAGVAAKSATQQDATRMQTAAKKSGEASPAAARNALQAELRRLTPAQKKEIGTSRLAQLKNLSGNQIVAGGCFTHGVGCKGTSGFTQGVICCWIKKKGG